MSTARASVDNAAPESDALSDAEDDSGSGSHLEDIVAPGGEPLGLANRPAGSPAELFRVAWPLIVSHGSIMLMTFCDRLLLTWSSTEALAASMTAAMMHYTVLSLALGVCSYVNVFVAQHDGADEPDGVATSVTQGVLIAIAGGVLMTCAAFFSGWLFSGAKHDPGVLALELTYFEVLCFGSVPFLLSTVLAAFYGGRGRTDVMMRVDLAGVVLNLVLDWPLIFGLGPIPAYGIAGAAWATVIAKVFTCLLYLWCMRRDPDAARLRTRTPWRVDKGRLGALLRFGLPEGLQYFFDVLGFTVVLVLIGSLGQTAQAATNLAFTLNMVIFLPLIGIGRAVSTIVGQRVGERRVDLATRTVRHACVVSFGAIAVYCVGCVFTPDLLIAPFGWSADPQEFAPVAETARGLLLFVAAYTLFDAMAILFGNAIRGAGDTRFSAMFSITACWTTMVVPTWLLVRSEAADLNLVWLTCTAYIVVLGLGLFLRYKGGKWQTMSVREEAAPEGGA